MTNPYRAMCAELLEALEIQLDELRFNNRLCIRARSLLDQPEPEVPTDEEIMELMPQQMRDDLAAAAPTLLDRAMAGDATAAKQFLHKAGFTDRQGRWLPQYQPIPEAKQ
jgi:hypothetical protein